MTHAAFIQVARKDADGCVARIRADMICAIVEMEIKNGTSYKKVVRLHLGVNNFIDCETETLDSVWNKINQAMGFPLHVVDSVSPDYPGAETPSREAA